MKRSRTRKLVEKNYIGVEKGESAYIGEGGRGNAWVGSWNTIRVRTPACDACYGNLLVVTMYGKPLNIEYSERALSTLFPFFFVEVPF